MEGLDKFITWLEGQDSNKTYNWACTSSCVFAQFAQAIKSDLCVVANTLHRDPVISNVTYHRVGAGSPREIFHSFGEALARAKAVRAHPELLIDSLIDEWGFTIEYARSLLGLPPIAPEVARPLERMSRELELA